MIIQNLQGIKILSQIESWKQKGMDSNEATPWWLNNSKSWNFVKYFPHNAHLHMKPAYEAQRKAL